MTKVKKHPQIHQMTIAQFEAMFPDEDACKAYLMANRWAEGVRCPRCNNDEVNELASMPFKWECSLCARGNSYRFSVLVGTIFENTNKPLRQWFRVMHMMLTSKKGISALQIYRVMGFGSYNTALLMCNKIRAALGNVEFKQLMGVVEVAETYIGGQAKNKHHGPGGRGDGGQGGSGKAFIVGAVKRKGNGIARVIANTKREIVEAFVREMVFTRVSLLSRLLWRVTRGQRRSTDKLWSEAKAASSIAAAAAKAAQDSATAANVMVAHTEKTTAIELLAYVLVKTTLIGRMRASAKQGVVGDGASQAAGWPPSNCCSFVAMP